MTARIESTAQLAELPIGTIIAATIGEYGVVAAEKTRSGWWKTTLNGHISRQSDGIHDTALWVGADIMVRKADFLAATADAAEYRAKYDETFTKLATAEQRITMLEEEIAELRREPQCREAGGGTSEKDWKNWNEPINTSVVVWRPKGGGVRLFAHNEGGWYSAGSIYEQPWQGVLAHIAEHGDGTPPQIVKDYGEASHVPLDESEPERVVVWESGDDLDKLRPYVGKEGVEVRAERDEVTMTGALSGVYKNNNNNIGRVELGKGHTVSTHLWGITVTAPKPAAPWWLVERIEPGHVVSWASVRGGRTGSCTWSENHTKNLAHWREHWGENADPATWRVIDVHAPGGPRMVAGTAS